MGVYVKYPSRVSVKYNEIVTRPDFCLGWHRTTALWCTWSAAEPCQRASTVRYQWQGRRITSGSLPNCPPVKLKVASQSVRGPFPRAVAAMAQVPGEDLTAPRVQEDHQCLTKRPATALQVSPHRPIVLTLLHISGLCWQAIVGRRRLLPR